MGVLGIIFFVFILFTGILHIEKFYVFIICGFIFLITTIWGVYSIIHNNYPEVGSYVSSTYEIASIQDNRDTTGMFALGFGYVDSTPRYYFYKKLSEDSYKLDYIDTSVVTIIETEELQNSGKVVKYSRDSVPFKKAMYDVWWFFSCGCSTEIHVPKNTIINNFILDAK